MSGWRLPARAGTAVAGCLLAGSLLLSAPSAAGAITAGQFTLEPVLLPGSSLPRSDFSFVLDPGQRVTDAVVLANYAPVPQTFELYAADGYNAPNGGGLALRPATAGSRSVGEWVHLAASRYTVPAHTVATVPFSLTIPEGARPGDHVGGIVALDEAAAGATDRSMPVAVHRGVAVAIFTRVSGPLHASVAVRAVGAHVTGALGFRHQATVVATLENTGNVQLQATVKVSVTDLFGDTVERFTPQHLPVLVPGSTFTLYEPTVSPSQPVGPEQVHVTVTTDHAGTVTASGSFWIVPWGAILVVVGGLAVAAEALRRRRRGRRQLSGRQDGAQARGSGGPVSAGSARPSAAPGGAASPGGGPVRPAPTARR